MWGHLDVPQIVYLFVRNTCKIECKPIQQSYDKSHLCEVNNAQFSLTVEEEILRSFN